MTVLIAQPPLWRQEIGGIRAAASDTQGQELRAYAANGKAAKVVADLSCVAPRMFLHEMVHRFVLILNPEKVMGQGL